MCLLIVASRIVPGVPLLIGANRDEQLDRPSVAMTVLRTSDPRTLGGRDEQAGGTWLAFNECGVFAGVTNKPLGEGRDPNRRSRGELPLALVAHKDAAGAVAEFVERVDPSDYNGCWLLTGDRSTLYFLDVTGPGPVTATELPAGLYVLENRALGLPSPKEDHVTASLGPIDDDAGAGAFMAVLHAVLRDHHVPPASAPAGDSARIVPNCVHLDGYGTRSSCTARYGPDPAEPPHLEVAHGPPCTTPFVDVTALWGRDEL
jgi:uncharacterized protein with NRDE domain